MKAFFCIAALVASAHAGIISTGASSQHRSEDGLGNYAFGYDEAHPSGGSFRKESGNAAGVKIGSYGLRDADGRVRTVNYVADAAGFRASVSTNEPGTAPSLPAAAAYNAAPAKVIAAAPVVAAASYAAPVVAAAPALSYAAAPALSYAAAPALSYAAAPALSYAAAPALSYAAAPALSYAAPVVASAGVPAQYAANVFAPSGTPFLY